ncbi:hypothetical protein M011DRAFT_411486 [Sporormia fimetaria CBS 119925]|uniref:GID complex catalytic subunit 2 n=1 Tax=Sporormia fimetaria CBS 119925 TaxID=1340428 RepID=A0A6A6UZT9_9PLEO|nr:hypothetical protein M011DRAFT_411486 [Sporormia fimetaria CBS 119925]
MDDLKQQIELLESGANLSDTISDVQKAIDLVAAVRNKLDTDPETAPVALARLQRPFKEAMDRVQNDLKPAYKALGKYSKALDKTFKDKPLPTAEDDALSSHPSLINRAIAMHLLREGEFDVASTFLKEATSHPTHAEPTPGTPNPHDEGLSEQDLGTDKLSPQELQAHFQSLYNMLHELRTNRNLEPAIAWAKSQSQLLELRGSNLEFELHQLRFISLFTSKSAQDDYMTDDPESEMDGLLRAWAYARSAFGPFQKRHAAAIQQLMGAMAFAFGVSDSPYKRYFHNNAAWNDVAASFTREYCSLLGLSADSPLYVATTAGTIALPHLLKMQNIMRQKNAEWTTQEELPVEIPLPPSYHFHSIFVCPVTKAQSTDENPPMMLPCRHVISREAMERISRGGRVKCPYCPMESPVKDAKKVVF